MRNELFREVVGFVAIVLAASFAAVLMMAAGSCLVGGREQGPSEVLTETARAYSDPALVPAPDRAVGEGGGREQVGQDAGRSGSSSAPAAPLMETAPASTVTQSALTAATVVIDAVPATPLASARPVETIAPKSDISALIAASPWPQSLWGTVACIVQRESDGLEWKVSPGGDVGLMQVGPANFAFLAEQGITRAALFDGATNLRAGWILYEWWQGVNGDGLTPWRSTRGGCA